CDKLAERIVPPLHHDAEAFHLEKRFDLAEHAPCEQFKAGIRAFIGIAERLAFLDLLKQTANGRRIRLDRDSDAGKFRQNVRAAGLVRDEQLAAVSDAFWWHMLVGARLLVDRRGVDATLMRKG